MRLQSSRWVHFGLLLVLGLVLFVGFSGWKRSTALTPPLEPLPQDPLIQVYFNHSQASLYEEPYRHQRRLGDNLEQVLVDTIQSAQTSVDVAIQELHLPLVAKALGDRHQAGIQVRVILEQDYNHLWSEVASFQPDSMEERDQSKYEEFLQLADQNRDGKASSLEQEAADSIRILQQAGVPFLDDTADGSKGSALMHHKFVVVDGQVVLAGSTNYSISEVHGDFLNPGSQGNANHLLKITSPALAQLYTQEFNLMWGDGPGGSLNSQFGLQKPYRAPQTVTLAPGSTITVQFSPTSSSLDWQASVNGLIGSILSQARRSADLALFVFSEQPLSDVLSDRHQQGVQIRALIDPQFLYRDYSEGLDMMGVALPNNQCRYEEGNQPWVGAIATVGTPQLPEGDILHHKFAVIDHQIVVTGSQNWSAAANHGNDENLLVINNPTVAAHFEREFERLYTGATLGVPDWLQAKLHTQQQRCH